MAANALLRPISLGTIELKNRIGMSALTRSRAHNTYPTDLMKEYYLQRADAGLIVSEGLLITRQGTEWPRAPGIWDVKHIEGWRNIVSAVHEAGGKMYAQLWHLGRLSHPDAPEQKLAGVPVYGPSSIAARGGNFRHLPGTPGYVKPTTVDDPWALVAQFKQAAINAKQAGFDGVELHGGTGYLITQFLDDTSNKRTDQWGGSVENRSRFGLEVLKALIEVFDRDVAIKLSPTGGYNDVGMPLQETLKTFTYFISEADKLGISYIVLLRHSPRYDPVYEDGVHRATQHDVLESYRHLIKNAKVFINGDVTPAEGQRLVSEGKVDGIFIGLDYIAHPDLVKRIEHGVPLDNPPNIRCFQTEDDDEDWSKGYTDYPMCF
ncbi:hypothetical protein NLJ89_g3778 [Agrocybe chaxingu]|uniref:NADH:flavin oxidoreductase/NADH oxidase N-terminal domain-containing protein n=1 Tax=Agrocybe chaxingu TaxID=84603 RepID=A0A9W8K535_9AGAR|nr:hypothetical protein NLJ89_g3778 [Agrocybe chaxingu]